MLDGCLGGPAVSLPGALSQYDPTPGHLSCHCLGMCLAAGPLAVVICPGSLSSRLVYPCAWQTCGKWWRQRVGVEADWRQRFPQGSWETFTVVHGCEWGLPPSFTVPGTSASMPEPLSLRTSRPRITWAQSSAEDGDSPGVQVGYLLITGGVGLRVLSLCYHRPPGLPCVGVQLYPRMCVCVRP